MHTVKLKNSYSLIVISIPIIIAAILLYLTFREEYFQIYMFLLIMFGSILGFIKYYQIPREIQLFDNLIKIKSIYGKELIYEMNEINSVKIKFGIIILNTKKNRIIGVNGFSNISKVFLILKESNPYLIIKGV